MLVDSRSSVPPRIAIRAGLRGPLASGRREPARNATLVGRWHPGIGSRLWSMPVARHVACAAAPHRDRSDGAERPADPDQDLARSGAPASHGSVTSRKAQRPRPPQLLTASVHRCSAVETLACFSFLASPLTSSTSVSRSSGPVEARRAGGSGSRARSCRRGPRTCTGS